MNNKEVVGFSSVNENELMNVDGGLIPVGVVIVAALVVGVAMGRNK